MEKKSTSIRQVGLATGVAVIVANMIGSGVFTSLGYQALDIKSTFAILMLWVVGGIVALCGALCYAELAIRYPGSGGEYNYVSKVFHPAIGFLPGWISATVGFAAPIAGSAMAFGAYVSGVNESFKEIPYFHKYLACGLIIGVMLINLIGVKTTTFFQRGITYFNISLIIILIISCIFLVKSDHFTMTAGIADWNAVLSKEFATSLLFVSFAYSGWNAVTYIAGEVENPLKTLPRSLFTGTSLVMVAYVSLNFIFMYAVPLETLAGKNEVGLIAGEAIFGPIGGKFVGVLIALALFASVNSMTIAGPRVAQTIGEDLPSLKFLSTKNAGGSPIVAIILQTAIALILVITSGFPAVITYIGFTLSLSTTLTVVGLVVARYKTKPEPNVYKTPLFPIPAIIFIALEIYSMSWSLTTRREESLWGLATAILGLLVYYIATYFGQKQEKV